MIRKAILLLAAAGAMAALTPAQAQIDEVVERAIDGRAYPTPAMLTPDQRVAYREIFAAIRASSWQAAAAKLELMGDGPLHPIARAELYLARGSPKVDLPALTALLARAPDLPQAVQLARLAETRGATVLPALPQPGRLVWTDGQPRRSRAASVKGDAAASELEARIQPLIRDNLPTTAEAILAEREGTLTPEARTEFQHRIGWSFYIVGDDASARRLADQARRGIGEWTLQAEWLHGLASWRMRDCDAAGGSFATVAARATDMELAAAGHYWAARADMMCRRPQLVQARLRTAARMGETFYGLLAQRALALKAPGAGNLNNYGDAEWLGLIDRPNVKVAIALAEIGERALADEVIKHQVRINQRDHHALIHLASDLNLPATQLWLAHNVPPGTRVQMAARYPAPDWSPSRGWRVDKNLVFAHTLQESQFRTHVVSPAGATGLMQVRPGTAGDIARARGEPFQARQLTEPAANIEYGQSYLEQLRDHGATGGLLPKVIAAYNAGPVPIAEWNLRGFDRGDPLLYIESIPYWETRGYVPTILRNYWIYEQRDPARESPTRKALVQGLWPRFPGMAGAPAVRMMPRSYAAAPESGTSQ
jgi:soluble lytic murein transglycosylase-like protein